MFLLVLMFLMLEKPHQLPVSWDTLETKR